MFLSAEYLKERKVTMKQNRKQSIRPFFSKQRFFFLVFSVVFAIVIVTGATFAWFVSSDKRQNEIEIMQYAFDVKLVENFAMPGEVKKGDTVTKEAKVKNTGDISMFVRVMVFPTLVASDGKTLLEAQLNNQLVLEDLDTNDWKDGGDGYFYYLKELGPGAETPELFKSVKINDNTGGNYEDSRLTITLMAESVETGKWYYRDAWWESAMPSAGPLKDVDDLLKTFAK